LKKNISSRNDNNEKPITNHDISFNEGFSGIVTSSGSEQFLGMSKMKITTKKLTLSSNS